MHPPSTIKLGDRRYVAYKALGLPSYHRNKLIHDIQACHDPHHWNVNLVSNNPIIKFQHSLKYRL